MTNDDSLLEELRQAAEPPAPKDFRPGVIYNGRMPSEITTGAIPPVETEEEWEEAVRAMGIHIPDGYGLALVEAVLAGSTDPAAWHRDLEDAKNNQAHSAYTKPKTTQRWRYRFKVVLKSLRDDVDLKALMEEVRDASPHREVGYQTGGTMIISLADPQVGKVDERGGTRELLQRAEAALEDVVARIRTLKPKRIILADGGDSTEGFNSAPNANRVNDLQEVEAHRVWRRLFWHWIDIISRETDDMIVLSVPSNHCSNRAGKNRLGPISDDWGLDALSIMKDMAELNPAYAHVSFLVPNEYEKHITLPVEGHTVSFIHGEDLGTPKRATESVKKMGRHPLNLSDIVVVSHFHRLSLETFGDDQILIINSALDGGSSWFSTQAGERSKAGVTTFVIDEDGWRDLKVCS